MPFGQLLMSIASAQSVMGNPLERNLELSGISINSTTFVKFVNWTVTSSNISGSNYLQSQTNKSSNGFDEIQEEATTSQYNGTTPNYPDIHNSDSLSIMWYLASFGALVMFFLLISFSEVCCKKSFSMPPENEVEVAPPPYDLFAPPTYDSLYEEKKEKTQKKTKKRRKCEIFVIPVFGDKTSSRVAPLEAYQESSTGEGVQRVTQPPPPPL